ncbi:MAG: recombinase family protein, partial [Eubacteriales bacterium]|nr:recombinase family protein [Eubacteriales bacterium]
MTREVTKAMPKRESNPKTDVQILKRPGRPARETPKKRIRAAVYCRVSTDLESQESSLSMQMSAFQKQIQSQEGWELAGVYTDEGQSGTQTLRRDGFNRMIQDCKKGKIDYILTKSISRFARNTLECLSYVRFLKEMGVFIYFEK